MSSGLVIAGSGLVLVVAVSVVWLRRHDRALRAAQATRHGWILVDHDEDEITAQLRGLTLFEVGHSRRIVSAFGQNADLRLFQYVCETGFEHRRRSHRWVVLSSATATGTGPAVISREEWLLAAAQLPGRRSIRVAPASSGAGALSAVVDDREHWEDRLAAGLAEWLAGQPTNRCWEVLPGHVVVYDPGPIEEGKYDELDQSLRQFIKLIRVANSAPLERQAVR
ncbi:MAG: hypothetical protein DCC65_00160 [Planctomycetota bacterium]|nr:MAG: hypothetical protein DCC65_00160 [Planctomycetota bacterium]